MSAIYPIFAEKILGAHAEAVDWTDEATNPLKIRPLSAAYAYTNTHDYADDLSGGDVFTVATSNPMTTVTVTNGILKCDNLTPMWVNVTLSATAIAEEALLSHVSDPTADTARPLLAHWDDWNSVTPNGGDINVVFNATGMFQLVTI